ncbi:MAG: rhomboid family intramembrane serine protease [Anaerolineales bacterium]|nr:rhomboid family intramembrane serine protease [Anaerolineales bacterium]MCB0017410.1 rhomboid family intramembrane serine protease [Anaerolineales bacterium]MCB0028242.1 rhomboid family intramembrane serine protease [Anaerolineales bacterium]
MIPLRDANPSHRTPYITIGLIVTNILIFLYELSFQNDQQLVAFFYRWGVVPAELMQGHPGELINIVTSMFLHGGWSHLLGNMLYLWIFGDNIEDRLGHGRFLIFYLLGGFVAIGAQVITDTNSMVPLIGASGAIAAVLGAYLVEFPRARVLTLIGYFTMHVPAILVLGFWFVLQFFQGFASLGATDMVDGGVAFFAHIGGFVAGLIFIRLFQIGIKREQVDWLGM